MPAAVLPPPTASGTRLRKRFSRDEVRRMLDAGFLADERLELIDGDLIEKRDKTHRARSCFAF